MAKNFNTLYQSSAKAISYACPYKVGTSTSTYLLWTCIWDSFCRICMMFLLFAWNKYPYKLCTKRMEAFLDCVVLGDSKTIRRRQWHIYIVIFFREGGEFYFSDIYADRELEDSVRKDEVLWGKSDLLLYDDCVGCRNRQILCSCVK